MLKKYPLKKAIINRNKTIYFGLIVLTILLGLMSRLSFVPKMIYPYLGDYLYAVMVFWMVGFLLNQANIIKVTLISIAVCYMIEVLQLCDSTWLKDIRANPIGRLILGQGFLWSDILSYTFGGFTGCLLEKVYYKKKYQI